VNEVSDKTLVIVESPTKARTLKKILGRKYDIKASNGTREGFAQKQDRHRYR